MFKRTATTNAPSTVRVHDRMTFDEFMLFVGSHPATTSLGRQIRAAVRSG